jgi:TonB family protein
MISTKEPVDVKTVNVETAVKLADDQQGKTFNADDPNLKPFAAHGGKLIMYHGWSDAALPPQGAINYFSGVQSALGSAQTADFMRLYMVPGMQHCVGGPGANSFGQSGLLSDAQHDVRAALEQWVEKGLAPDKIIATKFVNDTDHSQGVKMTRSLCPNSQVAQYVGKGDTNDAANFVCVGLPPGVFAPGGPVKGPQPLHAPDPSYSDSARRAMIQGTVRLLVIVGADGRVRDAIVANSLEQSLDANAIEAVKTWTFAPGTKDGKPVPVQLNIEISYKLR